MAEHSDPCRCADRPIMDWDGFGIVVDLDLEKFFDTLNQDFLMNILRERIKDMALIELIKRFLRSGVVLPDGLRQETRQGSPQGGPLSPLLSNIYLDRFDRLLESRGLRFCRYADDRLIFVRTPKAGERVRESVTRYLESDLKLKVNQEKTIVGGADTVKFLGFKLFRNKAVHVNIHPLFPGIIQKGSQRKDQTQPQWESRIYTGRAEGLCTRFVRIILHRSFQIPQGGTERIDEEMYKTVYFQTMKDTSEQGETAYQTVS